MAFQQFFSLSFFTLIFLVYVTAHEERIGSEEAERISLSLRTADKNCQTSVDCAMNGDCVKDNPSQRDPQALGHCHCFQGWKGSRCEELDLLDVISKQRGMQLPNHASTWGGAVVERDGKFHMFASEMVLNCGLDYWTTNSQVIRAVSNSPYGPFHKEEVILPTFAHEPNVVEAPTGEIVLFVTALKGVIPRNCTGRTKPKISMRLTDKDNVPPKDTFMLWAPHPEGPWSEPVLVLNSTIWNSDYWEKTHRVAICDSNLNGIILDDGSFLGVWRRCETPKLLTIPHTLTASDWRKPSTYKPDPHSLFVLGGSGAEDPSNVWTTTTHDMGIAYHTIFHDEQSTRCMLGQCSANGRHAFSLDGKSWRYATSNAYDRNISFDDGTIMTANTRARPHIIIDKETNQLLALSTGLKPTDKSGYVWTVVQPLRSSLKTLMHYRE